MERPSPVPRPCGFVVKNGSKILGRSSRLIPVPVSTNSSRISSARSGLIRLRTVSVPRESIASMALSINAMKLWISRSWSPSTDGRPDASSRITVSRLKRAWCLSRNNVRSTTLFTSVGESEEHTSELQSLAYLVCRLLLEKKKNIQKHKHPGCEDQSSIQRGCL